MTGFPVQDTEPFRGDSSATCIIEPISAKKERADEQKLTTELLASPNSKLLYKNEQIKQLNHF